MGNKCCRSDGHVAIDSFANAKHDAQYSEQVSGSHLTQRGSQTKRNKKSSAISFDSTSSDEEAVQQWRDHWGLEHTNNEPPEAPTSKSSTTPAISPTSQESVPKIGSDVDSVTKDQYLSACRLLHNIMVQRQDRLTDTERTFLQGLLNENNYDSETAIPIVQFAAIENATKALANDPLFLGSPMNANLIRKRSIDFSDNHEDMMTPTTFLIDQRERSINSTEILRQLKVDEVIMLESNPTDIPPHMSIDVLEEGSHNVEMILEQSPSIITEDDSLFKSDYQDTDDGTVETPPFDLEPSKQRLTTVKGPMSTFAHDNYSPGHFVSNDPPGPYKHFSSLLQTEPELIDDDDVTSPFRILGVSKSKRKVLTPALIEALRGFLPYVVSEENFWLKFTMESDGDSLINLLHSIRGSKYTFLAIRSGTKVFGSFTGTKWRKQQKWYGSGEAFLWRVEDSLKVYPFTGSDTLVQYCTNQMVAVGGGDWKDTDSPYSKTTQKQGIGLLIDADLLGGESNSSATFCNPTLSGDRQEFNIDDLEVWTLTPCMTTEEAEKLELHKLFVEEQSRS